MFEQITGNDEIKRELEQTIKLNKTSHSYLFIGTEGIGKKIIAREFASKILDRELQNSPDFIQIEPDGNSIKIEQIRNMQKKILEAPIASNKKIYIINDADKMTKEAQNCLLKTLEEPPEFAIIILIGSIEDNFLSTIKSRCTILKFKDISNDELKGYLKQKYNINNITENMLDIFQGSIGKAEKLKDKEPLYSAIFNIINEILEKDIIEILKTAEIIYKSQDEKFEILDYMNIVCFNKSKEDIRYINCIEIIEETKKRIKANGNYSMCIDNMLFKIWEEMH
ncbi:MAG: DNA polymerase III subunit [Clostridia bacterium]|nr:DNA polymerase III subunit [Clostridia bacterium]